MKRIIEDEIKCPHCMHEFDDSYEKDDDGVIDCPNCDKPFGYTRNVTISYTMEALEREKCPNCGEHEVLNDYHGSMGAVNEKLCESCLGVAVHKLRKRYIESLDRQ